jgi:putative ABC transport system permease protein
MDLTLGRYYLWLGIRNLRRNPALATLAVLILAIGIAASMTSLAILRLMSADPLPGRSSRLFVPAFDNRLPDDADTTVEPQLTLTWLEADALLRDSGGPPRAAMYGVALTVQPPQASGVRPFFETGMATSRDFFSMFQAPFAQGASWSAEDDQQGRDVVVLSAPFATRLFGTAQALGATVTLKDQPYRVVGVLAPWRPVPRLWRLAGASALAPVEDFFIPLRNAIQREMPNDGWTSCSGQREPGWQNFLAAECNWLEFWVELAPDAVAPYRARLDGHVAEQRQRGRLQRADRAWLKPMAERARDMGVVRDDTKLQAGLSVAFLAACLVNVIGLLGARFANRAGEIGVRRALGASRRQVMLQFLVESGVVGLAGALLGLALTWAGLALMSRRSENLSAVAHLDAPMMALAAGTAVLGALLAGLWPTWRASRVRPALQLKTQ